MSDDVCVCGHPRSRHMMGGGFCGDGCYTNSEQRAHIEVDKPLCERFTARPARPMRDEPQGYHYEAVTDDRGWRFGGDGRLCRSVGAGHQYCRRPAVASLLRSRQRWYYCERHLYGRWIENGQVMIWVLRADEDGAA